MRPLNALSQIGSTVPLNAESDTRDVYLELRGFAAASGMTLPSFEELADKGVEIELTDEELTKLISESNPELRQIVETTNSGRPESATVVAYAAIIIGLAVVSKLKYTKDRGWEMEPGFPGLSEVLDKINFPDA